MHDLIHKVAVVTGGASGIGLAPARRFLAEGMKVALLDLHQEALAAAQQSLAVGADRLRILQVDVTDRAGMRAAAEATGRAFGNVHVLCNNAGVGGNVPLDEATGQDWDRVLGVNLGGVINGLLSFLPGIKSHGEGGHIVNTGSITSLVPMAGPIGIYTTSKFAVRGLTEALRMTLAGTSIGVSLLCPGIVSTNIVREDPAAHAFLTDFGMAPDEVAGRVLQAIRDNSPYVLTHGEFRDEVRDLAAALVAAFPDPRSVDPRRLSMETARAQADWPLRGLGPRR